MKMFFFSIALEHFLKQVLSTEDTFSSYMQQNTTVNLQKAVTHPKPLIHVSNLSYCLSEQVIASKMTFYIV